MDYILMYKYRTDENFGNFTSFKNDLMKVIRKVSKSYISHWHFTRFLVHKSEKKKKMLEAE